MNTASLIFFSPTGTTLKTVEAVCDGLGAEKRQWIDLTRSHGVYDPIRGDLAIVGLPVHSGRPDRLDLEEARSFGEKSLAKAAGGTWNPLAASVPGKRPYKESRSTRGIRPAFDAKLCTKCLSCVAACPTGAIAGDDPGKIDGGACIRCAACIKICPAGAKRFDDEKILEVAAFLHGHCAERKTPEYFF